jgi:hypothetical protein
VKSLVLEKQNVTFVLNISAQVLSSVSCNRNESLIVKIMRSQSLLNIASGFDSIVVRHGGEEMMSDVGVSNVVLEIVNAKAIGTINSKSSSTLEVPDLGRVMGHSRIGVLIDANKR